MLAPVMTMREGERIYSPGGRLLETGDRLEQPGLVRALEAVAAEGAETFYRGSIAEALQALMEERGGLVTRADLDAYRPEWREPARGDYAGGRFATRGGFAGVAETLARLRPLRGLAEAERAVALADALAAPAHDGHTTNLTVVDRDGNACVLTTSLGLGSGDFLPGLDVHLNSMLGEVDLVVAPLEPGERMASMMAPTVVLDREGLALAAGAAGGTRLRSALVQVLAGVLDEGREAQAAVDRPRLHRANDVIHLEPGFPDEVVTALERRAESVRIWPELHHYFGGVSAIARSGAAADPRRSGLALPLR
jgi:gamma-glutamyltranspeptidase/glutathione hydrolase